jgi:nucleoside phosphorylase
MSSASNSNTCRAVIVTALPVEFNAVCEHLTDRCEETHPQGTVYEKGCFRPIGSGEWEIIVAEIGAGNVAAAAEVERVINHCQPNVVLFVGIAGGIKDVEIGDVVAGNKVYGYESGKESEGFKPRPMVHESNYRLVQRAKAEARSGKWRQRIPGDVPLSPPRVLIGPIAAGEKVVADSKSATAQLIIALYGDALAVEMEGYGFLHGAYLHQHLAALVIRGISDLLDLKSKADGAGSQERASRNASAFCFEILAKLGICPGDLDQAPDSGPSDEVALNGIQSTLSAYESRLQIMKRRLVFVLLLISTVTSLLTVGM